MDKNIALIYDGARALGLPVTYFPNINYLNIHLGRKHYYFCRTVTPINEGASIFIAKNKFRLNKLLEGSGFPVPKAVALSADNIAQQPLSELIRGLQFPLVAKPMNETGRGYSVLCNINDITVLAEQVDRVLKNRVIGVVERFAASVIGDGEHSIEELIEISNRERDKLARTLTISPLVIDEEYLLCLNEQNLSLQSIPSKGAEIRLCYTVNTGRGGDIFSHGKKIHPQNAKYLCDAARVAGLAYVGFDVLCEDINLPFGQTKWLIIEANFNPDLTIHEIPHRGKRVSVVKKILRQLIYRHPLSYVYHFGILASSSIYVKTIVSIGLLIFIIHYLI